MSGSHSTCFVLFRGKVCLITTLFATDFFEIKAVDEIEPALKKQLIISTGVMAVGIALLSWLGLSYTFTIFNFGAQNTVYNWQLLLCVAVGLWAGLMIGFVTEYYTSNAYSPVQDVADSCRTGAATNVFFGLALGYKSVIIPIFAIAISIFLSFSLAAMYGVVVAALGMLSTIATGLAIDAYGPISDNAGGIAEMAGMSHRILSLDAAGNTTGTIGKGFAIGSAPLVSIALFGAFVIHAAISTVDVLTPKVFIGLILLKDTANICEEEIDYTNVSLYISSGALLLNKKLACLRKSFLIQLSMGDLKVI